MHTLRVGARPSSSSRSQKVNTIPEVVKMDANLLKLSARMRWEDAERNAIRAALTQPNYSELFTKLATLALAGSSQRLRAYDVPGVKLTCVAAGDTKKFSFSVSPHLINNRRFRLHNGMVAGLTSALDERFAHGTFVSAIDKERAIVTVNASDAFYQSWGKSPETLYDVHWLDSTVTVNRMAFAITQSKPLFPSLLFPSERTLQQLSEGSHPQQVESCIPNLNREQKDAAAFITAPSSHLLPPYLMFGPPGTGKTTVLVECILRLLRTSVSAGHRILVCAPANKACDLVAGRLKNEILRLKLGNPQDRVLRLVAESRPLTEVDQSIHDLCFCTDDGFVIPEKKDLQQKEVVICTCSTSAAIYTSGDSAAFSHIFIDEAGQATEPESVLPIVAIQRSSNARIALFGDPFQLGPVIQYPTGLSIYQGTALHLSLLERLSHLPGYQSEQLATAVKAQLIRSYRAHPKLMQVSNERFYENKLQACAPVDERFMEKLARLPGLRNKKCPIIFETVQGLESKQSPDPSRFNVVEAERVLHHVKTVHNACEVPYSEIGVISPYSAQVDRIRDLLDKHGCNDVRVGSVEEYQGDEKTVIIISTVRTSAKSKLEQVETDAWENALGFLRNPKRFNVAMTRAKKLLVVVGDPRVLVMEEDWYAFLVFCRHENAIIGKDSIWEESKQIRDRWLKRHQVSN
jgi:helicase MOV-10